MAHTVATVEDLEAGSLPWVCAKTGDEADVLAPVEFTSTPGWTWILLLFGFFPWLIARYFAKDRIVGQVPLSSAALRRAQLCTRATWVFLGLAVALIVTSMVQKIDVLAQIGFGTLLGGLIFALLVWLFVWPRGYLNGEWVELLSVDKRFARAVDLWYGRKG